MTEAVEDGIKSLNFLGLVLRERAIVARRGRSEYRSRQPVLESFEGERVIGMPSRRSRPYRQDRCQYVHVRQAEDYSRCRTYLVP